MKKELLLLIIGLFIKIQPLLSQSTSINYKQLIKDRSILFTNPKIPDNVCEHNDELVSSNYKGIVEVDYRLDTYSKKYYDYKISPINRSFKYSLYPLEIVYDSLLICSSSRDLKPSEYTDFQSFFILNLNTVTKLNEVSIIPNELCYSDYETVKFLSRYNNIYSNESLKFYYNNLLTSSNGKYLWNDEFQKHDYIDNKIKNIRNVNLKLSNDNSDYIISFKGKLREYEYNEKRFFVELDYITSFSKKLMFYPFDIHSKVNDDKLNIDKSLLGSADLNSDKWSNFRGGRSWTYKSRGGFYQSMNYDDGKKLARSLNSEREVLVTLKLIPMSYSPQEKVKYSNPSSLALGGYFWNYEGSFFNFSTQILKLEPYFDIHIEDQSEESNFYEQELNKLLDFKVSVNDQNLPKIVSVSGGNDDEEMQEYDDYDEESTKDETNSSLEQTVKTTNSDSTSNSIINISSDQIFEKVEQQAEFPGGPGAWGRFLQKTLKYPSRAQRANVGGRVFVSFIINTDGSIQEIQVVKGVGFGCDEEAIRVIEAMPRWIPGRQSGRAVRSRFTQPITFVLSE